MSKYDDLSPIQKEIYKAIKQLQEKASFTEFNLAKKIRENTNCDGKKKAGIALNDLLASLSCLAQENIFYSICVNSVNECLLRKAAESSELPLDSKQRRQKSEKAMEILTNSDIFSKKKSSSKNKGEKRSSRTKLSIYGNYDDE